MRGAYTYRNGFNPAAMIALVAAVLPVVPGFIHAASTPGGSVANPGFLDHLYQYAWFVTFGLSFAIYLGLMKVRPIGDDAVAAGAPAVGS